MSADAAAGMHHGCVAHTFQEQIAKLCGKAEKLCANATAADAADICARITDACASAPDAGP